MIVGIVLGLSAATCQSLSYLFSRLFSSRFPKSTLQLLVLTHVLMGVISLALAPWLWPERMLPLRQYAVPLLGCALSYLVGQACLFLALQESDASRVSPLLGLKVIMLAAISVTYYGQHYVVLQWAGVVLSAVAALMLSASGGRMAGRSVLWIVLACVGYAISDLNIKVLVDRFGYLGLFRSSVFSTCLCYILCGAMAVPGLLLVPRASWRMWRSAVPFTVAWYAAMLLLFGCFGSIGVVFGNIVQASRGVISILLGSLVAASGLEHLERRVGRWVLLQRASAALLMTGAIALFYLGNRLLGGR